MCFMSAYQVSKIAVFIQYYCFFFPKFLVCRLLYSSGSFLITKKQHRFYRKQPMSLSLVFTHWPDRMCWWLGIVCSCYAIVFGCCVIFGCYDIVFGYMSSNLAFMALVFAVVIVLVFYRMVFGCYDMDFDRYGTTNGCCGTGLHFSGIVFWLVWHCFQA